MRGNAEIRPCPTENSGREQLPDLEKGSQAHASRLEDAFYAVIYTTRAPGKASSVLLASFSSHEGCHSAGVTACCLLHLECMRHHVKDLAFSASSTVTLCCVQKRKNKSFKDGVLRLCSNRSILYDEVTDCRALDAECPG